MYGWKPELEYVVLSFGIGMRNHDINDEGIVNKS